MSQPFYRRVFVPIGFLQMAIILLVIATAFIHLQHGLAMGGGGGGAMRGAGSAGPTGQGPGGFTGTPQAAGTPGQGFAGNPPGAAGTPGVAMTPGQGFPGNQRGFSGGRAGGPSLLTALPLSLSVLFMLNFIGYLVLGIALYLQPLQRIQRIVRWLLILFAVVTIVAWFLIAGSHPDTLGIVDKIIEGALIILLLLEEWQAIRRKGRGEPHASLAEEPLYSPVHD
jgi:hypothetical protein